MNISAIDFQKGDGLVPVIVQDATNYRVLMLGYMNEEALEQTMEKGLVTFYSRSKQRLWTKGETSGNTLRLVDLQADCDRDTLLVLADPAGPTCHTGHTSCFYEKDFSAPVDKTSFLNTLDSLIRKRKKEMPEGSYTSLLFREGTDKIAQKVGEEAIETIIEAKNKNDERLISESADLLYHLMVLLAERGLSLGDVAEKLESRHGK